MGKGSISVLEIVQGRFSTGAFLEKSVPRETIEKVLDCASWSPSGANLRPWQVVVLTGQSKRALSNAILKAFPIAALGDYPDIIRKELNLVETLTIVCGMAMGYADEQHPVNNYRTERESVTSFTTWFE